MSGSDSGPHRSRHGVVGFGVVNGLNIESNAVVRDHGPFRLSISFKIHDMMISESLNITVNICVGPVESVGEGADTLGCVGHERSHQLNSATRQKFRTSATRPNNQTASSVITSSAP